MDKYTPSQAARILNRTPQCVTQNIRIGKIKAERILDRWLISEEEIKRLTNRKEIPKPEDVSNTKKQKNNCTLV